MTYTPTPPHHVPPGAGSSRVPLRVLTIVWAVVLMVLGVMQATKWLTGSGEAELHPAAAAMASPGTPIPSEADVFRLRPADVAVPSGAERRATAHPRTMGMYRAVRAYPGAPPRVPHGLTEEELRKPTCNSCHERGGFAPRFGLYAPVTPHPQNGQCLQCHVPLADLVGLPLPDGSRSSTCRQCHTLEARTPAFVAIDWPAPVWPRLDQRALEEGPPRIPHDLQMRGNCLACHAGPAAVREIRTTHPERANCRQCHVPAVSGAVGEAFTRPLDGARASEGGRP